MPLQLFGDFGMAGGQDVAPNYLQNNQICINFYAEVDKQNPKETIGLLGCPGLIQLVAAPGGGVVIPSSGDQLFSTTFTDNSTVESGAIDNDIEFDTNGVHKRFDNLGATHTLPNWFTPTTTGIGSSHFVRVTETGGAWGAGLNYVPGPTLNVWTALSSTKVFSVTSSGSAGHYVGTLLIEVSPSGVGPADASGTYTFDFTMAP